MNNRLWWPAVMVIAVVSVPVASAQQEDVMIHSDFIVMPHMKGSLALPVASLTSVWFKPASGDTAATIRVMSQGMSEAKALSATEAEAVWELLEARSEEFVFVGHMEGTLAIPMATVRTAYFSDETGVARLRLRYDADPSGKTIEGDDAERIWSDLQR